MKKLLSLALACTLTLGLASCGGTGTSTSSNAPASSSAVESPAAQFDAASYLSGDYPKLPEDGPAYSLSIGHAMQESTESHKMLLALKDAVEKYSDGKITITIYPNSQLGSDSEMIASCVAGDMDMVLQCGSTHATFVPETVIFDIPFLFSGYDSEKIESVLTDSKFRDLYNQANEDGGLVCLMLRAGTDSMNLTSNKPVTSMEDLKGLKIRTAQVESRMAVWNALGANPTPMAFNELYMALQNGTVDAQDNNLSNALTDNRDQTYSCCLLIYHTNSCLICNNTCNSGSLGISWNRNHIKTYRTYTGHSLQLLKSQCPCIYSIDHTLILTDRNKCTT